MNFVNFTKNRAPRGPSARRPFALFNILIVLLTIFGCRDQGEPPVSHFQAHSLFRLEPIPNVSESNGLGPHDSMGFRGNPSNDKANVRVLVLGGAFVYGQGHPAAEAMPALIEKNLLTLRKSAVVANAGCPGQCVHSATLRFHFNLSKWNPTHIVYIPGSEDLAVYAAANFESDLNHVPRPWTGVPFPKEGALTEAGAAAYERDLRSLEVLARMNQAKLLLCAPNLAGKLAPLNPIVLRAAQKRQIVSIVLHSDLNESVKIIAEALSKYQ